MEKDLLDTAGEVVVLAKFKREGLGENSFDYFQKTAASAPKLCYNKSISQNDLGCELQAKEGVLV
jgi:hypothetical protein